MWLRRSRGVSGSALGYLLSGLGIYKAGLVYILTAMLMLLFRVGEERWAIAASHIQDVIPLVDLQKTSYSYPMSVGLLNYHGDMLTTVDVSQLIGDRAAAQAMSTRIVVVKLTDGLSTDLSIETGTEYRLALMVEQVSETARLSKVASRIAQNTYAEGMFQMASGEVVRQLAIASIFSQLNGVH